MDTTRHLAAVRRSVVTLAAALLAVSALSMLSPTARAQSTSTLFHEVGTLERFPADARAVLGANLVPEYADTDFEQKARAGTYMAIPEVRQLWQIFTEKGSLVWAVVVRDLDSLRIIRTFRLPAHSIDPTWTIGLERDHISIGAGSWSHAIDPAGKRLFLVSDIARELLEYDLASFKVTRRPLPASSAGNFAGLMPLIPGGMTYDDITDDIVFLYGGPPANSVADTNTFLYTVDVSVPPPAEADRSRLYHVRSCTGPLTSVDSGGDTYGWEVLVSEKFLYVPCHRAGNVGAVIRLGRPPLLGAASVQHVEEVVVGPVYVETALADPASGRLFLATTSREIWVFEATTMSFIGIVATGRENTALNTGYGLDRQTGRLFFQSREGGLGVVEGRFFPLPQARTIPRPLLGQERILSDTRTNRIFVLAGAEGQDGDNNKSPTYHVFRTEPAPVPPGEPDPDRNTADIEERDGLTEARYFASASGYGVRVLLAKGISTVVPAPSAGVNTPTAKAIDENFNPDCGYTDRELLGARVHKAEYDTGSTAASAIGVDVDVASRQDLDQPARCDAAVRSNTTTFGPFPIPAEPFPGLFGTAPVLDGATRPTDNPLTPETETTRWDRHKAECSSSEGNVPEEPTTGDDDYLGHSQASCPAPGNKLEAEATAKFAGAAVSVGTSWTKTSIQKVGRSVRSSVESVAQDVELAAGQIKFAEIRSVATSQTNGRPHSGDLSKHEVTVRGAKIGDTTLCKEACDLAELVDELNFAAGGRAIFRVGKGENSGLDAKLKEGSPRGALTAVQKSAARQASDQALVGDFTTEIPGLEMTVFNDNTEWGRARQLYQFAGVSTAATYNIVLRPAGFGGSGDIAGIFPGGDGGSMPDFDGALNRDGVGIGTNASAESDDSEGGVMGALKALARGIRLFLTSPRHSLLLLTAWALFSLPAALSRRRRLLADIA